MAGNKQYCMLIDLDKCIGCYGCQVSCKNHNDTPFAQFRCKVDTLHFGSFPNLNKIHILKLCNNCENPPCVINCNANCYEKNTEGVVLVNQHSCLSCKTCVDICPYHAVFRNPTTGKIEKCDFCIERVNQGLTPVCVENCVGKAIRFGNIYDKNSELYSALRNEEVMVLNREMETRPCVYYIYSGYDPTGTLKPYKPLIAEDNSCQTGVEASSLKTDRITSKTVYTADVMCPAECAIAVEVEQGIATHIKGNPHSLVNQGTLCGKGAAGLQFTYSLHRIKTPLLRCGKRGEDEWRSISWEEACDYIAKKLTRLKRKFGAESVVVDCGDVTDQETYHKLFYAFGTPNVFNHGSVCDTNRKWGQKIMLGDERPLPDLQRPIRIRNKDGQVTNQTKHDAKLVMHLGVNSLVATRFSYMPRGILKAKKENGCIFIVTDPSFTNSAAKADIWLPVKPGSDSALLAAMLCYILKNDDPSDESRRFMDHNFIANHTIGWADFRETFLSFTDKTDTSNGEKYYSPDWATEKTGIQQEKIREVARLFGITKPAAIEIGMHGTAHHTNGDVTSILMTALCLITGNVDVPGGLVFIDSQKAKKGQTAVRRHHLEKKVERTLQSERYYGEIAQLKKDTFGEYPASWKGVLTDLPDDINNKVTLKHGSFAGYQYPIKAFINRAGNPIMTAGNTKQWIDAFLQDDENDQYLLELIVFIDTHINETGKYADVVLPEAGYLERMGLSDVYAMSPEVALRDQVIKPLFESKTDFEIMMCLAEALGNHGDTDISAEEFGQKYKSEEEFIDELLLDTPGFYNLGDPLPYPDLPEGAKIVGVPDDPIATVDGEPVKKGSHLSVAWLREHHGIATWPTSYYRYKNNNGSPSAIYPATSSKKFEFAFNYLTRINRALNTDFPTSFYWYESKWNPKNTDYKKYATEFPFQLISGRAHHTGTMTQVCPNLSETETECMVKLNDGFSESLIKEISIDNSSQELVIAYQETEIEPNSLAISVITFNKHDGESLGIKTGDMICLETPQGQTVQGKAYLSEEILPGVIKTVFGSGGRLVDDMGIVRKMKENTPNINMLIDPGNVNRFTGMPGFGDIMVKVTKLS